MAVNRLIGVTRRGCVTLAACAAAAAFLAAGSGSSSAATTHSAAGKHEHLMFLDSAPTTYGLAMEAQARQTAAANNASVTVEDANFDPERQNSQCQSAIANHQVQGLLIYAVDPASLAGCVKKAAAAGIKVASLEGQIGPQICTARGHQVPGITLEVYFCPNDLATYWAKVLVEACPKTQCSVAVFTGPPSEAFAADEFSGLQAALKKYPSIKIDAHYAPGYDAAPAAATDTRTLMLTHPQTNVIIEDDDGSAAGVAQALATLGKTKSVKLIGTGTNAEAVQRIKKGTEFASVLGTPRTDMKVGMTDLLKAMRGGKLSQTEITSPSISPLGKGNWVLTKSNAAHFVAQWS